MANELTDPSFELGTGWVYSGKGARTTDQALAGSYSAVCQTLAGDIILPDGQSTISQTGVTLVSGAAYGISFWFLPVTPADVDFRVLADNGSGSYATLETFSTPATGSWIYANYAITAAGTSGKLRFRSLATGLGVVNARFYIDSVFFGDSVAIKLSERAVDAVVAML